MRKIIFILFCLFPASLFAQDATGIIYQPKVTIDTAKQTDLIDIAKSLFNINPKKVRTEKDKKVYFSIIPSSSAGEGTGRALITSTSAGIFLGSRRTTYLSSATFAPYWNFAKRFGLPLRTSIWLPDNTWNIQGDTRFLVYPQYTWGLGSQDSKHNTLVNQNYLRFYQAALKRINPYLFAGAGYNLDYHFNIATHDPNSDLRSFTGYQYGTNKNSVASGLSLNLLYDTRNNSINPLPGAYANLVYRINPTFLGSNNTWQSLYLDLRKYIALDPTKPSVQNTLAFWSYLWTSLSKGTPYLDLPSVGWDPYNRSARGIDQSRYRGQTLYYFESEYRRDITRNGLVGFVAFANVNTVSGSGTFLTSWHPAAGAGLRIKFNKGSNTNVGLDYGFSKNFSQAFLNLGETF